MSARKCPQIQNANENFIASEIQMDLIVKDTLGNRSDEVEPGDAGSASSFEALFSNLVLELQEMRTQIGLLSADAPAHLYVVGHTARSEDHGCRICCPKMCWHLSEHGLADSENDVEPEEARR